MSIGQPPVITDAEPDPTAPLHLATLQVGAHAASVRMIMLGLTLAILGSTGCTAISIPANPFSHPGSKLGDYKGMEGMPPLPTSAPEMVYQGVRQARAQGGIVLHVPSDNPPVRVLPLPEDGQRSVYVSNLLRETGVQKKLGNVHATLFRHSSDSLTGIPMECRMTPDGESVRPESDYALQPGDRLRVVKAPNPAMQNLVDMVLGR